MALPNNKQELADWILRRLGAPVININVADIQLEDCIDEAVQMYQEYHFDGAQRSYRTIKITKEMLAGNERISRQITAPMYDIENYDEYRIGDRVTTYDTNQQPTEIWVKVDSETSRIDYFYLADEDGAYHSDSDQWVEGELESYDSDQHVVFVYNRFIDSDAKFFEPANLNEVGGGFFVYASGAVHSIVDDGPVYFYRDSDNEYYEYGAVPMTAFDSEVFYFRELPTLFLDSDGTIVNYDSDKHVINQYNILSFDSDPTTLGVTLYVDSESLEVFVTDSDVNKVIYDSERHTIVNYEEVVITDWVDSENPVYWIDSEGEYVEYDSDKHTTFRFDSDLYGDYIFDINTEDAGDYVLYDSDTDSDGLYLWNGITRFNRAAVVPTMYKKVTAYPVLYYRHKKIPFDTLLERKKTLLGTRYSRFESTVVETKTFEETWKKEAAVLTEPTLNMDYSKEGQIGIPVPDNVIGVTKVFKVGQQSSIDMYNYEYQMFLNNFDFFYGNQGGGLSNYYTLKMNLEHIDFMLNTQPAIRFNKFKDRLYIDMDWKRVKVGEWLVCEVYEITDPEVWGKMYSDTWLKRYATALVKMQWGTNLRKYANVELPGGIVLNGQELYDEGKEESQALEETLKDHWGEMDSIIIG